MTLLPTRAETLAGVIDVAAESALLAVSGSDIVLIAVPVAATEPTLRAIRHLVAPGTLIMDAGSTKADVAIAAQKVLGPLAAHFVPAHPIAGKELSGVQNADALLFQGRQVILTPLPENDPALVQRLHREYIAAGAELIESNTFGANRYKLAAHGLGHRVRDINLRGVKVAREAREVSGEPVFLAGSVGPIGRPLAPVGTVLPEEAREAFREQIEALLEGGPDLLILETLPGLAELREAVLAARAVTDLPLVAQVTFTEEGRTLSGEGMLVSGSYFPVLGAQPAAARTSTAGTSTRTGDSSPNC